ncbi:MAG: hypothetical protein K7J46_19940 [Bryobacter sp.]|jgi:hypothetical protein|nr:hypothetical protein [Bryobacter sp. CoA8 C33]
MAKTDHALVVGLSHYPAFQMLDGPVTDAEDFYQWLIDKGGGDVPANQVKKMISKPLNKKVSVTAGKPSSDDIEAFFVGLEDIANRNQKNGHGRQVGRRLYIFLAGHGFALTPGAGLLAANASITRPKFHIPGMDWANLFAMGLWFEEILLFMDCCRNTPTTFIPNPPGLQVARNADPARQCKRLYVFAAPHGRLALERKFGHVTRGVFSQTLMTGLRGAAANPATGEITSESLRGYLFNNMRSFLDPADLLRNEIAQEPALEPSTAETGPSFVIARVAVKNFPIRITPPAKTKGKVMNIRDGIAGLPVIMSTKSNGKPWDIQLPTGNYVVEIVGGPPLKTFIVRAGEEHHVEF